MRNATRKGLPIKRKSERQPRITVAEYKMQPKPSKYRNVKCEADGLKFDSLKERNRYTELKLLEDAGEIDFLEVHPLFRLMVEGELICKYSPDFSYYENGKLVVEDVKSEITKTYAYRIKKKLMKAIFGVEIREV